MVGVLENLSSYILFKNIFILARANDVFVVQINDKYSKVIELRTMTLAESFKIYSVTFY